MIDLVAAGRPLKSSARPKGAVVDTVVLHGTASKQATGAQVIENHLRKPLVLASYHYMIDRDGKVFKCVSPNRRAWHAGFSSGPQGSNVNRYSIGIAFVTDEVEPITAKQLRAAILLVQELRAVYPLRFLTSHAEIAPRRKTDPKQLTKEQISLAKRETGLGWWRRK